MLLKITPVGPIDVLLLPMQFNDDKFLNDIAGFFQVVLSTDSDLRTFVALLRA